MARTTEQKLVDQILGDARDKVARATRAALHELDVTINKLLVELSNAFGNVRANAQEMVDEIESDPNFIMNPDFEPTGSAIVLYYRLLGLRQAREILHRRITDTASAVGIAPSPDPRSSNFSAVSGRGARTIGAKKGGHL